MAARDQPRKLLRVHISLVYVEDWICLAFELFYTSWQYQAKIRLAVLSDIFCTYSQKISYNIRYFPWIFKENSENDCLFSVKIHGKLSIISAILCEYSNQKHIYIAPYVASESEEHGGDD